MAETFELNFIPHSFPGAIEFDFSLPETEKSYQEASKRFKCPTVINDLRGHEYKYDLFRNGFKYTRNSLPPDALEQQLMDMTEEEIARVLVPHTEDLVRKLTGSFRIITAGYRLRNLANDTSRHMNHHGPSHEVHCDFSMAGAMRFAANDLLKGQETELLHKRMLVVNVWRPLRQVTRDPLAVCDWLSISEQPCGRSNLVPWKVSFDNGLRQNESLKLKQHDSQRWYYLQNQLPTEPLLFLCFDSHQMQEGGMTVPHSAFVHPSYSDAEPRISFEIKFFCFLEN
ncbi:hypothetical protein KVR01_012185 [Diaporthe batatas]|uniref:uncharacterized protein n=1 Tax=Diaporthe batatas TaxID=748121 RepID=UPI001D05373E|nr:uncharacterized protein KVR01_012185 [Diaporthe batatas]KAG8157913.1 hypothetical protein KVR01_012185 [Diaporthe batatas]